MRARVRSVYMSTAIKVVPPPQPQPRAAEAGGGDYLARAVSLHLAGRREEALKQLQRAVSSSAGSPEIYRAMAHIQFEVGDYQEAAKSYRLLTQSKPQYAMGWFNLAVCLERMGDWDSASQAFHQATK